MPTRKSEAGDSGNGVERTDHFWLKEILLHHNFDFFIFYFYLIIPYFVFST